MSSSCYFFPHVRHQFTPVSIVSRPFCYRRPHYNFNVSFYNNLIRVTVVKKAFEVDRWIHEQLDRHRNMLHKLIIGLDIEWLPNFNPEEDHPVATLQLCIGNSCLIFQLLHKDFIPSSLHAFLQNEAFTFVGIGIQDDVEKLGFHHGLMVANTMDLNTAAALVNNDAAFEHMGLKRMANVILQQVMPKPKHITLSQWDVEYLSFEQIEYACIDAFVSFELGIALHSKLDFIASP